MNPEFSRQICEKYSNMKFHENSSSGSRIVPRERADKHCESLIRVAFPILAKAPNDCHTETCWVRNYPIFHAALRTANYRH